MLFSLQTPYKRHLFFLNILLLQDKCFPRCRFLFLCHVLSGSTRKSLPKLLLKLLLIHFGFLRRFPVPEYPKKGGHAVDNKDGYTVHLCPQRDRPQEREGKK